MIPEEIQVELVQEELSGDIGDHLVPFENESAVHFDTRSKIAERLFNEGVGIRESLLVGRMIAEKLLTGLIYPTNVEKYLAEFN